MRVIMNFRQGLFKSEITPEKMCRIVICEMDGGGQGDGEIELNSISPETLIDLGVDIIDAAVNLQHQLSQENPDENSPEMGF